MTSKSTSALAAKLSNKALDQISSDFKELLTAQHLADVEFLVHEPTHISKVYGHAVIITARNPVLAEMIRNAKKEGKSNGKYLQVAVQDTTAEALTLLLQFIYTGSYPDAAEVEKLEQTYKLAQQFKMDDLRTICSVLMVKGITAENVCEVLEWAKTTQHRVLIGYCISFIQANLGRFVQSGSLLNLSYNIMEEFVKSGALGGVKEIKIFNLLESWITHNKAKLTEEQISSLIHSIRYPYIHFEDLLTLEKNSLVPSYLIQEAYKLITYKKFSLSKSATNVAEIFPQAVEFERHKRRTQTGDAVALSRFRFPGLANNNTLPNGVIYYLGTKKMKSKVYQNPSMAAKPKVTVVPSSVFGGMNPLNCLSQGTAEFWTNSGMNEAVTFKFNGYRVIPTHYAIKHSIVYAGFYPRLWVFEGSNDGTNWVALSTHNNDTTINMQGQVGAWAVGPGKIYANTASTGAASTTVDDVEDVQEEALQFDQQGYSQFRFRITGLDTSNTLFIGLSGFEIYGSFADGQFEDEAEDFTDDDSEDVEEEFGKTIDSIPYVLGASSFYTSCANTYDSLTDNQHLMTGAGVTQMLNPWLSATFKKPMRVTEVTVSCMSASAPGAWGPVYCNGATLQYSKDGGITWTNTVQFSGHDEGTNILRTYPVNVTAKHWRIIRINETSYLGLGTLIFKGKRPISGAEEGEDVESADSESDTVSITGSETSLNGYPSTRPPVDLMPQPAPAWECQEEEYY